MDDGYTYGPPVRVPSEVEVELSNVEISAEGMCLLLGIRPFVVTYKCDCIRVISSLEKRNTYPRCGNRHDEGIDTIEPLGLATAWRGRGWRHIQDLREGDQAIALFDDWVKFFVDLAIGRPRPDGGYTRSLEDARAHLASKAGPDSG